MMAQDGAEENKTASSKIQREAKRHAPPSRWQRLHWATRLALSVLFVVLALGGSVVSVSSLGRTAYRWHGFQIELRLLPSRQGRTSLVLRPLGEVQAHTHAAPVALLATLEEIQVEEIKKLVAANPKREDLAQEFERTARADLQDFVLRQFAFAALGSLAAPLLFRARRARIYVAAVFLGTLGTSLMVGNILHTFDRNAFRSPVYTGTLKQAPWVIQFGKDAFTKIEALSQKLQTVAKNLDTLYGRINAPIGNATLEDGPDTFRVLHVSDIHNNSASLAFIRQVADQFKVKFIVDTGDLTDFGSPPETVLVNAIGKMPYPYVFVLGNHDSQTVATALAAQKNVTLLDGKLATVDGVTLLGLANPAAARVGVGSVDTTPDEIKIGGDHLLQILKTLPTPPDIIAIHDPEESRPVWGRVPLVLCGHEHRYYIETHSPEPSAPSDTAPATPAMPQFKTTLCNAGTTGAAGGRYLDKAKGVPLSCAVLTFHRPPSAPVMPANSPANSPANPAAAPNAGAPNAVSSAPASPPAHPQLRAIDLIVLNGELDQYSITHYTFNAGAAITP